MDNYIYCLDEETAKYLCHYYKLIIKNNEAYIFENILLNKNKVPELEDLNIVFMDKLIFSF